MPTSNSLRIQIVGTSGSGKSTLAKTLATNLDIPRLELDSIYHQANWTPLPDKQFRKQVTDFSSADSWIVDGNYSKVRDILDGRIKNFGTAIAKTRESGSAATAKRT